MSLPFPFGLPLSLPVPTVRPDRRELVDQNNQIQDSRLIDAGTKDYVIAATGHFVGQSAIRQQVYLALITKLNTSSVPAFGNGVLSIRMVTPNIQAQVKNATALALKDLIDRKRIVLVDTTVQLNGPGVVIVTVEWRCTVSQQTLLTNVQL